MTQQANYFNEGDQERTTEDVANELETELKSVRRCQEENIPG